MGQVHASLVSGFGNLEGVLMVFVANIATSARKARLDDEESLTDMRSAIQKHVRRETILCSLRKGVAVDLCAMALSQDDSFNLSCRWLVHFASVQTDFCILSCIAATSAESRFF